MDILTLYNITFNSAATEYLIMQLGMGTTLSGKVQRTVDFGAGKMFVALPDGTDVQNLPKFEETGRIRWRRRGFATLAFLIRRFLAVSGTRVLLQDTLASPSEEWLRDYTYRDYVVSYNEEVHWRLNDSNLQEDDILGLIYSATFRPFSAFFYAEREPTRGSDLNDSHLDQVVKNLCGVAVDVFDEESFLLWWSHRLALPSGIKTV